MQDVEAATNAAHHWPHKFPFAQKVAISADNGQPTQDARQGEPNPKSDDLRPASDGGGNGRSVRLKKSGTSIRYTVLVAPVLVSQGIYIYISS